jgi:hypothetical protein
VTFQPLKMYFQYLSTASTASPVSLYSAASPDTSIVCLVVVDRVLRSTDSEADLVGAGICVTVRVRVAGAGVLAGAPVDAGGFVAGAFVVGSGFVVVTVDGPDERAACCRDIGAEAVRAGAATVSAVPPISLAGRVTTKVTATAATATVTAAKPAVHKDFPLLMAASPGIRSRGS